MPATKKTSKESGKEAISKKLLNKNEKGFEKAELSKKEKLDAILDELKRTGGIAGSAIVSRDGLAIASDLGEKNVDTFAAMSAAMQGAAETAASELKQGSLKQIIVDADEGKIITISTGEEAILVILAKQGINLGLVLLELGKAAGKIADILGG